MLRFIAHMLEVIRAAEAPQILRQDARRREPVGPFPAVALPEHRTHACQLVVYRTGLRRARIGALLIRIVNDEYIAIRFLVLLHDVALAGVRTKTPRVRRHHVDAGLTLDYPLGQLPSGTAGSRDAETMTLVEP